MREELVPLFAFGLGGVLIISAYKREGITLDTLGNIFAVSLLLFT